MLRAGGDWFGCIIIIIIVVLVAAVVLLLLLLLEATAAGAAAGGEFLDVDDGGGPAAVDGGVEVLLFVLVEVGARVGGFVLEHLHEAVEARGEEGAEDGAEPVDLRGSCQLGQCVLVVVVVVVVGGGGGEEGWSIPNGSGGRCVGRLQGQKIGLGLKSRRCRRRLKAVSRCEDLVYCWDQTTELSNEQ